MQEQEQFHSERYGKLLEEVNKLKKEKEQQQNLLAQSLLLSEEARIDASLKHEIARLANENLVGLPDLSLYLPFINMTVILFTMQSFFKINRFLCVTLDLYLLKGLSYSFQILLNVLFYEVTL